VLCELGRSDRRVHELVHATGEPQNLVSYHLRKLRDARLVSSRRSSADARDAWYRLDLDRVRSALADTGAALHPGLRAAPPALEGPPPRVLFLCTGNSARSQMAEAFVRTRSVGRVVARSAGSHPRPLHPGAVRVMREDHGIDIAGQRPKHLDDVADEAFDRVVTLCDRVREVCPEWPGVPETVHWSMPNPADPQPEGEPADAPFRRTADELETRIGFLLAGLRASPSHHEMEEQP
jgi:protein-tyrosine-phosphatase/DNA-binding transcriptional ArsR family regulator